MAATTAPEAGTTTTVPTVSRGWDTWRVALLVWLGAVIVATLLTGTRPASLAHLQGELASGQVTAVTLVGELPPGVVGSASVQIAWHDGLMPRYTEVKQVREDPVTFFSDTSGTTSFVSSDLTEELTGLTPSGELRVTTQEHRTGSGGELYGWRVPTWTSFAAMAWLLATLFTLVSGPEPRWATRWAWFWLFTGSLGLAMVPFTIFGLPRGGQPVRPRGRRLTGGWAFLIGLLLPGGTTT